jgi:hypothetical protein
MLAELPNRRRGGGQAHRSAAFIEATRMVHRIDARLVAACRYPAKKKPRPLEVRGHFDLRRLDWLSLDPGGYSRCPERFRAKWIPVRVKKTRQNKKLELRF